MKRFLILLSVVCLGTACSTKDDDLAAERTAIENYLAREDLDYRVQNGVYIHVENQDRTGYEAAAVIEPGDEVLFNFILYTFTTTIGSFVYTNVEDVLFDEEDEPVFPELDTTYWNFDPETVIIGSSPLIKGLQYGLIGCREGDAVQFYLTSDLAYGDRSVNIIPPETAIMWKVYILKVNKN